MNEEKPNTGFTITTPPEDILAGTQKSLFQIIRERRGWTDSFLNRIQNPSYPELQNMQVMVDTLHNIKLHNMKLVVMPDFDMDGITSGTIGYAGFAELGFNVELYVPDYRNGHDITVKAVDDLIQKHPGVQAVITCDAGINSVAGIQHMKEQGLVALVTDHHVELSVENRVAHVSIDPGRIGETYEIRDELETTICGAHVLWQVLSAYAQKYMPHKLSLIGLLRLFGGIGTISDVMPITFENRQMVKDSISISRLLWVPLDEGDTITEYDPEQSLLMQLVRASAQSQPFISAMLGYGVVLKVFRDIGKLKNIDSIDEGFYGFYLGPAFNSIRRIEGEMENAFAVFTAHSIQEKEDAMERIIEGNEYRKELVKELMEIINESDPQDQPYAPYVYIVDAPGGMLGLLANTLMNESGLPTVVLNRKADDNEPTGGSARTPFWYPLISTITPLGFTAIGHENACGVNLQAQHEAKELASVLAETSRVMLQQAAESGALAEANQADLVIGVTNRADNSGENNEMLMDLAVSIDRLEPFGHGFTRPTVEVIVDLSKCHIQYLGKAESEDEVPPHLKIVTQSGLKLLWWNKSEKISVLEEMAESVLPGGSIASFLVQISINDYMGHRSIQAQIEKFLNEAS